VTLPIPLRRKITVRKAIIYGLLWINFPVLLIIVGLPAILLFLALQYNLPPWLPLVSFPVAIVLAWLWWSLTTPKWRLWAFLRVNNLYLLQINAVRSQLVWPRGSIYENTEFKSPLHVLQEKHIEIHHYFDKFRYYLDYLETTGKSFSGLQETRLCVDNFRETLYSINRNPLYMNTMKVSIDQLRPTLKSIRTATGGEAWTSMIDGLLNILDHYQQLSKETL
jgi:hypothetical protein